MPVTEISFFLFVTTVFYFEHKNIMPACAKLANSATGVGANNANTGRAPLLPAVARPELQISLIIWFVSLLALVMVARWKTVNVTAIAAFGIALTVVGLLMVGSTCLLGEFIPRYGLPMWELLLLSLYLFVGKTAGLFAIAAPRASPGSDYSKQSAGQRRKLG